MRLVFDFDRLGRFCRVDGGVAMPANDSNILTASSFVYGWGDFSGG